jgi:hypothetical protein
LSETCKAAARHLIDFKHPCYRFVESMLLEVCPPFTEAYSGSRPVQAMVYYEGRSSKGESVLCAMVDPPSVSSHRVERDMPPDEQFSEM